MENFGIIPAGEFTPKPAAPPEPKLGEAERAYLERFAAAQAVATSNIIEVAVHRDGCRIKPVMEYLAKLGWVPAEPLRPSYGAWKPATWIDP